MACAVVVPLGIGCFIVGFDLFALLFVVFVWFLIGFCDWFWLVALLVICSWC